MWLVPVSLTKRFLDVAMAVIYYQANLTQPYLSAIATSK